MPVHATGFSTQQAEGIVSVLVDVFRANDEQNIEYQVAYRDLVSKS